MTIERLPILLVALAIFGTAAFYGIRQWRESRHNDTLPVLSAQATLAEKRTNTIAPPANLNPKVKPAPSTSRFATFSVSGGQTMEFQVSPEQWDSMVQGKSGKLTYQGSRFLNFQMQ